MKKLIALVIVAMFALTAFAALAENGTLTLATNVNFPPYEFYDDETGEPTGIDIEIAKAICEKIGYDLEVVDIDFGAIIPALAAHSYDFSAAGMTVTEERKQSVQFTDTYATGIQAVIVPGDTEAEDIYALIEAKGGHIAIGVQESTTGDIYISDEFETAGTADVQRFKNGADAVLALTSGQVDCVVIDNEPAKAFVAKNDGLKLLASAYTEEDYAMAFPLDSEIYALIEAKGGHIAIGVQESTTGDIYISDEFETAGTADVQRFKNGADAVLALTSGQVDCVVIDNEPAKAFVAKNEGLKLLASAYTEEDYAMAFPLDSEIYETFNAALQELMADGTLKSIVDQFIPAE